MCVCVCVCVHIYIYIYIHDVCIYVIFKNQAEMLCQDLKHKAIAKCFRPDKGCTVSFLNVL